MGGKKGANVTNLEQHVSMISNELEGNWKFGLKSFLPDIGRGTHEHIIEEKEASLLGFDDFTALIVDRLYHVVWADQVAIAVTQQLEDEDNKSD